MQDTHASRGCRQWQERERVSSSRKWIACSWVFALVFNEPAAIWVYRTAP